MSALSEEHTVGFGGEFGADSPLWYAGLLAPEKLGLPIDLCRDLREWANTWQDHSDPLTDEWVTDFDGDAFERKGDDLAQQVANQLGPTYQVRRPSGILCTAATALCLTAVEVLDIWALQRQALRQQMSQGLRHPARAKGDAAT